MSYAVIHMQKLKISSIRGIENHNERLKKSKTNPDIDYEKSHLNKDLMEHDDRSYYMRVKARIEQLNLHRAVRKDAVVTCGFICTSDQTFFENMSQSEKDKFFQVSHDFIKNRYGEKNMISSKVHYDETTPHSHAYIVPVTEDGRLSAKSIFTRTELRGLQDDYFKTMRENGFDLQRGEGKAKHLSVQEYKIETKLEALKEKQALLEKLENVDKLVHLEAEKGKLMYSPQEVDAIKEQNIALKVENNNMTREVHEIERKVERLNNQLFNAQKDINDTQVPLDRLKDLDDVSEAFKKYLEKYPELAKAIEPHDLQKKQAYIFGNTLHTLKQEYYQHNADHKQSINNTYKIERTITDNATNLSRLSGIESNVNLSKDRLNGLEDELEFAKGVFKLKKRKEITDKIETEKERLLQTTDSLKTEFEIEPCDIEDKRKALQDRKEKLKIQKADSQFKTEQLEKDMTQKVDTYKYYKTISNSQDESFKRISNRRDGKAPLRYQDQKLFRVTKNDRGWIAEEMQTNHPHYVGRCKENWQHEDASRRMKQSMNMTRDIGIER